MKPQVPVKTGTTNGEVYPHGLATAWKSPLRFGFASAFAILPVIGNAASCYQRPTKHKTDANGFASTEFQEDTLNEQSVVQHAESVSPLLGLAIRSAAAAGAVVRDGCQQINVIEQKKVGDLVSEVDRDADLVACATLAGGSSLPILSEELHSDQEPCDDMWIVDPLDATNAFLMNAGTQYPSVLIALRQNADTELGVVYFPITDEWFYAQRGRGAWCDGKRLVCDSSENLNSVWVEMNQYGNASYETPFFADLRVKLRSSAGARMVTSNVPHSGVAMRIAQNTNSLAVAIHDNNPNDAKQEAWDIAAPQIVMEEAGGVFLNPAGDRTDPFTTEPIIVSRSAELAKQVIELANKVAV